MVETAGVSPCQPSRARARPVMAMMKSIVIATLFVLVGTAAQAEITCDERRGCWKQEQELSSSIPAMFAGNR